MPVVTIEGHKDNDVNKKRKFVKDLTSLVAKFYGLPESTVVVLIKENPLENISTAGTLVLDIKH